MYKREAVEVKYSKELEVQGNLIVNLMRMNKFFGLGTSLNMLLYNFLEEVLYIFSCDPYMAVHSVSITEISKGEGDFILRANCHGEEYDRRKHGSKTEIKAVTFSNMRIISSDQSDRVDIYVIFDI